MPLPETFKQKKNRKNRKLRIKLKTLNIHAKMYIFHCLCTSFVQQRAIDNDITITDGASRAKRSFESGSLTEC